MEQLEAFMGDCKAGSTTPVGDQKIINNRKRGISEAVSLVMYQKQSNEITGQLAIIRGEIKVADGILSRSLEIKDKPVGNGQKQAALKQPEFTI